MLNIVAFYYPRWSRDCIEDEDEDEDQSEIKNGVLLLITAVELTDEQTERRDVSFHYGTTGAFQADLIHGRSICRLLPSGVSRPESRRHHVCL